MEWLIGALVVGGITGILGAIDSVKTDEQAETQIDDQLKSLEKEYLLATEEADLKYEQAKEEAGRNADQAKLQADLKDKESDITEKVLSSDFNKAINELYLSQKSDTYSWNNAAVQAGSSTGNALASIAGSGIRAGSSLSDAVMLESAANSQQLNFTQEAKRSSDSYNLSSVLYGLAGNKVGISGNRIGADITRSNADYLINSFLEGGSNYNIYQKNLEIMGAKYLSNQSNLLYEKEKHTDYDRNGNWTGNKTWSAVSSFFSLGAKGAKTAYGLYGMGQDAGLFGNTADYKVTIGGDNNG